MEGECVFGMGTSIHIILSTLECKYKLHVVL